MNVFLKITLKQLFKNKVRTAVTVVGIMLSTALICAVAASVSSATDFARRSTVYVDGDWHGRAQEVSVQTFEKVSKDSRVKKAVFAKTVGVALTDEESGQTALQVTALGTDAEALLSLHLTTGRFPEKENELILSTAYIERNGLSIKPGDTLELTLQTPEGEDLHRSYTVVGIAEQWGFAGLLPDGAGAFTRAEAPEGQITLFFKLKNPEKIYDFMKEYGFEGATNDDVLMFSGVSAIGSVTSVLYGLAAIILTLTVFGSVSLIYNAFAISVSERTRQFGLLSSVGATAKQLRATVLYEALAVSAVGIPAGLILGISGIGITFFFIGEKISSLTGLDIPMRLVLSPGALLLSLLLSLLTVLISAFIPSLRASRVSAVEAIRQNTDIKSKKTRTSKITYALFGLPGVLASKHFKRNRKKYRTTVLSLFMSVVLFVSSAAFTSYLTVSVEKSFEGVGYDLLYSEFKEGAGGFSAEKLLGSIKSITGVTKATYLQRHYLGCTIDNSILTDEYLQGGTGFLYVEGLEESKSHQYVMVFFLEDAAYKQLLRDNGLDEKKFMNADRPLAIAFDRTTAFNVETERLEDTDMLKSDSCTVSSEYIKSFDDYYFDSEFTDENGQRMCRFVSYKYDYEGEGNTDLILPREEAYVKCDLTVGATLKKRPYFNEVDNNLSLVYPISLASLVLPEEQATATLTFPICTNNHRETNNELSRFLTENGLASGDLFNLAENVEQNRNIVTVIKVFSYGFIVLISLIAAANVFNTISTGIHLRRREFAMLKSVGMSKKGFYRMMNYECLLYGSKALLLGLPASAGVTWIIYKVISDGMDIDFVLPIKAMAIATLSVFAVVFITMLYAMGKIAKDNPIDALKNENL
ncbi:MAG: ABC transporter permease [Clostridia bacterium]|nr:ABC transporter permease [Clostridia bacterium]